MGASDQSLFPSSSLRMLHLEVGAVSSLVPLQQRLSLVSFFFFFFSPSIQVNERGGNCVPVICDSTKDEDIVELFERIKREQNGRLDLLVNNAYAGVQVGFE